MLANPTPEGARDYLVPSRVNPGNFYALPQSPQQFKQLLMVAGFERYFQIARCFRDEDLRADRQPEFTQLDLEMSLRRAGGHPAADRGAVHRDRPQTLRPDLNIPAPFPRLTYDEAMRRFGSDKPDLRYGLELVDLTNAVRGTRVHGLQVARRTAGRHGRRHRCARRRRVQPQGDRRADRDREDLRREGPRVDRVHGRAGGGDGRAGALAGAEVPRARAGAVDRQDRRRARRRPAAHRRRRRRHAREGAGIGGSREAGARRAAPRRSPRSSSSPTRTRCQFCWILEFPLFEWSDEDERYYSVTHPFTAPVAADLDFGADPAAAHSQSPTTSTCNGQEIGGGSIRIHQRDDAGGSLPAR